MSEQKHINGGVRVRKNRDDIPTKHRLKAMVLADPSSVEFYATSETGPQWEGTLDKLREGYTLVVVGPSPYVQRRWFANIIRLHSTGELKVG